MVEITVPANIAIPMYSTLGVTIKNKQTTRPTRVSVSHTFTRFAKSSRFVQKGEAVKGVLTWFSKNAATVPAKSQRAADSYPAGIRRIWSTYAMAMAAGINSNRARARFAQKPTLKIRLASL